MKKINKNCRDRVRTIRAKFRVGQHDRISMEKMKHKKGAEQNFSQEIFRINRFIKRTPRPIFELEDLNKTPIVGQLYPEKLTPVRITNQTTHKINKIIDKCVRRCIQVCLVPWQGYNKDFDSWIHASSLNNI